MGRARPRPKKVHTMSSNPNTNSETGTSRPLDRDSRPAVPRVAAEVENKPKEAQASSWKPRAG
jgi:hypothetical protein